MVIQKSTRESKIIESLDEQILGKCSRHSHEPIKMNIPAESMK